MWQVFTRCFHFGLPGIGLNVLWKTSSPVLLFFLVEMSKRFKILFHSMNLASFVTLTPSFRQFPFTTRVYDRATQASRSVSDSGPRVSALFMYVHHTCLLCMIGWVIVVVLRSLSPQVELCVLRAPTGSRHCLYSYVGPTIEVRQPSRKFLWWLSARRGLYVHVARLCKTS